MKKAIKIILISLACLIGAAIIYVVTVSLIVRFSTGSRIVSTDEASKLTDIDCIIVLGCQVKPDGRPSDMLYDRVKTGVDVFDLGTAPVIFMSGDNRSVYYNETGKMRELAIGWGVPENAIRLDPMGLSTYDSMWRAKNVYGFNRVVIVTQGYHLYRAIYVARALGLEAWGVSASLRDYRGQFGFDMREILARNKDFLFSIFKPQPTTTEYK